MYAASFRFTYQATMQERSGVVKGLIIGLIIAMGEAKACLSIQVGSLTVIAFVSQSIFLCGVSNDSLANEAYCVDTRRAGYDLPK